VRIRDVLSDNAKNYTRAAVVRIVHGAIAAAGLTENARRARMARPLRGYPSNDHRTGPDRVIGWVVRDLGV
jgi:hypothetical protein